MQQERAESRGPAGLQMGPRLGQASSPIPPAAARALQGRAELPDEREVEEQVKEASMQPRRREQPPAPTGTRAREEPITGPSSAALGFEAQAAHHHSPRHTMYEVTFAPSRTSVSAETPMLQLVDSGSMRQPLTPNSTSIISRLATTHAEQKRGACTPSFPAALILPKPCCRKERTRSGGAGGGPNRVAGIVGGGAEGGEGTLRFEPATGGRDARAGGALTMASSTSLLLVSSASSVTAGGFVVGGGTRRCCGGGGTVGPEGGGAAGGGTDGGGTDGDETGGGVEGGGTRRCCGGGGTLGFGAAPLISTARQRHGKPLGSVCCRGLALQNAKKVPRVLVSAATAGDLS